jgi:hypothetical protein
MVGNSLITERLAAYQEGLSFMKLVNSVQDTKEQTKA